MYNLRLYDERFVGGSVGALAVLLLYGQEEESVVRSRTCFLAEFSQEAEFQWAENSIDSKISIGGGIVIGGGISVGFELQYDAGFRPSAEFQPPAKFPRRRNFNRRRTWL